jgi:hypothetical protein
MLDEAALMLDDAALMLDDAPLERTSLNGS